MRVRKVAVSALAVAGLAWAGAPARVAAGPPDIGVSDARLARLFVPLAAPAGTYEVFRSPRPITELVAEFRALDPAPVADAWKTSPLGPGDAFGSSGPYDLPKLARLYGGTRPLVARGSLRTEAGVVGYTLISPWPDPELSALQPGTMTIVVHVTALTGLR